MRAESVVRKFRAPGKAALEGADVMPMSSEADSASGNWTERARELGHARHARPQSAPLFVLPRIVGPGRRERDYQERLRGLASALEELREREAALGRELGERERLVASQARELDASTRLERGCQRLLDRLEERLGEDRARLAEAEQQQKRLILTLGALQRENELLRQRLELAPDAGSAERRALQPRSTRGAKRSRAGWLGRLLRRD